MYPRNLHFQNFLFHIIKKRISLVHKVFILRSLHLNFFGIKPDFSVLRLQRQINFFPTQLGLALIFRARIGILARLYRPNTEIRRVKPANKNVFFREISNLVRFSNVFAVRFSLLPLRRLNYRPNRHSMAFSCY